MDIVGLRDVQIKTINGSIWNLINVRYVLGLKKKLIFVGQLDDSGHSILVSRGMWKVSKIAMVLACEKKVALCIGTFSNVIFCRKVWVYVRVAKQIFGMRIIRDKDKGILKLSQQSMLRRFSACLIWILLNQ